MSYRDRERPRDRDEPSSRYSGRDWGGRDDYRGRERVMTSTVQAPGRTELPPEMINKRKQREEKHARAKKQKIQEEEFVPQDEEQAEMLAMMGIGTFGSTKGKVVSGNEKAFGVKTKSRTKFQYLSQRQRGPRAEEGK